MQIGDMDLSVLEADTLDRCGVGMYAVKGQNRTTYTFYWDYDKKIICSDLTEEQAQGILTMLVYLAE